MQISPLLSCGILEFLFNFYFEILFIGHSLTPQCKKLFRVSCELFSTLFNYLKNRSSFLGTLLG